jgi:hypothetical protein
MPKKLRPSQVGHSALVALGLFSVLGSSPAFAEATTQTTASTSSVLFSGTDSGRSASALFNLTNNVLSIALNNTSTADSLVPTDILTGLFFDIGSNLKLNPISAMLGNGSTIYGGSPNTTNVGGEWAFNSKLAIGSSSYNYGMSAAGLGLFGPKNRFDTSTNLSGTENVGGLDYGIVTAGDKQNTGNGGLDRDLIKGSVIFSFGVPSLPSGFDLTKAISNVRFQYGTNTAEPSFAGIVATPPAVVVPPVTPPPVVTPPVVVPPVTPPAVVVPPVTPPPVVIPPVTPPAVVVPPVTPVVTPPVTEPPVVVPPVTPPAVVVPPVTPVVTPPVTEPLVVVPPVTPPPVVTPPVTEPPVVTPPTNPTPPTKEAPQPVGPTSNPTTQKVPEPSAIAAILLAGAAMLRSRKSVRIND